MRLAVQRGPSQLGGLQLVAEEALALGIQEQENLRGGASGGRRSSALPLGLADRGSAPAHRCAQASCRGPGRCAGRKTGTSQSCGSAKRRVSATAPRRVLDNDECQPRAQPSGEHAARRCDAARCRKPPLHSACALRHRRRWTSGAPAAKPYCHDPCGLARCRWRTEARTLEPLVLPGALKTTRSRQAARKAAWRQRLSQTANRGFRAAHAAKPARPGSGADTHLRARRLGRCKEGSAARRAARGRGRPGPVAGVGGLFTPIQLD